MKRLSTLLRISALVALLQGLAHAWAIFTYVPHHGPAETLVVAAMRNNSFRFGGPLPHSYWELYLGYAILAALTCLVESAALVLVSRWIGRVRVAPVLWLAVVANVIHAGLVLRFFFITPLIPDVLLILLLSFTAIADQRLTDFRLA